jgi:hypothetical protein
MHHTLTAGLAASLFALMSCSSATPAAGPGGGGSCQAYTSSADLSAPVTFSKNVLPIFQTSCAAGTGGTCHVSGQNATPGGLFLGGAMEGSAIVARLVGMKSGEEPNMNLVTAGDPTNSYLMHKMDGDACTLAAQCNMGQFKAAYPDCGSTMPMPVPPATTSQLLSTSQRDTVRAWIKQGAQND